MLIPWQQLSNDALYNLAESFVLREGTDYGDQEFPLAAKVQQVLTLIQQGQVVILYSELHESVDLMSKTAYQQRLRDTE